MSKHDITNADFKLFLVIWNQRMGLATPPIHRRMADWLEGAWKRRDARLLLMAFRSSGKSTIVGVFCAWLLYRWPELRILVLAADEALAGKMVRNVKRIIERHPLCVRMKPDSPDQWAADRFTVRRMIELRDPSMLARGVSGNITGSRADVIVYDDVEVPNTSDSAEKRHELRQRIAESAFVLTPGGLQLFVGTPHTYYSIYAAEAREELGEAEAFLEGYRRLEIPVLDENGQSAWPGRYGLEEIERFRKSAGPNRFASQMMLRPVNVAESRLNPKNLVFYDSAFAYDDIRRAVHIAGRDMVSASAWWDPSFAERDSSVLAVVFTCEEGFYWLHKLEYIRPDPLSPVDNAAQQCRKVAQIANLLMLPSVTIEGNGMGKMLTQILRTEMHKAGARATSVVEVHQRRPKSERIVEAFDVVLAARALRVNEGVRKTPFIGEMIEWHPGLKNGRDDGLDAVAGALSQSPVRINREYKKAPPHDWVKGLQPRNGRARFDG